MFGKGLTGLTAPTRPIDCANAGTLVRLIAGILAGQPGQEFELVGDESLSQRPMGRIAEPLTRMGAGIETAGGFLPMGVQGRPLHGIEYVLPVASAQVKSAVLLAGLYADGPTTVVEPAPTRDHTERMLAAAGANVRVQPGSVTVDPTTRLALGDVEVPGDFSSAAPFVVAATLVPGSELHVHGVNLNPRRTGLLGILERMGAKVTVYNRRPIGGEPRRPGDPLRVARRYDGRGARGAARNRRAAAVRPRRRERARAERAARRGGAPCEGDRPDRGDCGRAAGDRRPCPRDRGRLRRHRRSRPRSRRAGLEPRRPPARDARSGRGPRLPRGSESRTRTPSR